MNYFFSFLLFLTLISSSLMFLDARPIMAQSLNDPDLSLSPIYSGFKSPTGIGFLDETGKNILVIEKGGNVNLISNGTIGKTPILTFVVDTESERGLLGVDVLKKNEKTFVFFYVTERLPGSSDETQNLKNRVYSFEWDGANLVERKLLLDLPALPGPNHDGGKVLIGEDDNLYVVIGDLNHRTKLQNFPNGDDPDFTGSIFRINPEDGSAPSDNPFVGTNTINLEKTYGYGIRNSFGLTFDPLTGKIWDTENGPSFSDEINLVNPGFNSGWRTIMGPISDSENQNEDLVNFPNSYYSDPLISWQVPVAVTDIEFINTTQLGPTYQNNILVGDYNNGNLYFFRVNESRTGLDVGDMVIDSEDELSGYILGTGFGGITDIKTGPDGKMYVVSYRTGTVYTIS
jgi:glucose/arabinose dehydrogenase